MPRHIIHRALQHLRADRSITPSKLADDRFQPVFPQPVRQRSHRTIKRIDTFDIPSGKVVIQVLVDINGGIVDRISELVEVVGGRFVVLRRLEPGMSPCIAVPRGGDELGSPGLADRGDSRLVVEEDERGGHVVRFVHQAIATRGKFKRREVRLEMWF